ncbi:hypothetical protein U1Q18_022903 [Sarracenia purpurea var. burkii]
MREVKRSENPKAALYEVRGGRHRRRLHHRTPPSPGGGRVFSRATNLSHGIRLLFAHNLLQGARPPFGRALACPDSRDLSQVGFDGVEHPFIDLLAVDLEDLAAAAVGRSCGGAIGVMGIQWSEVGRGAKTIPSPASPA